MDKQLLSYKYFYIFQIFIKLISLSGKYINIYIQHKHIGQYYKLIFSYMFIKVCRSNNKICLEDGIYVGDSCDCSPLFDDEICNNGKKKMKKTMKN